MPSYPPVERALTVGQIAKRLNCPVSSVIYHIRRLKLVPKSAAGPAYIYSAEDFEAIKNNIERVKAIHARRRAERDTGPAQNDQDN